MIGYKPIKYKELLGEYQAVVTAIEVEDNNYYDPAKENSMPQQLSITFEIEDPETPNETYTFIQRFISPLFGQNTLFGQLVSAYDPDFQPDLEGAEFDEQKLVWTPVILQIGKNKKGYMTIESLKASPIEPKNKKTEAVAKKTNSDLPF